MESLLTFTPIGIYCPRAQVYLDPWKPVDRALITHGHADHATGGHRYYLCTRETAAIIAYRLHLSDNIQTVEYGEKLTIQGVTFSFHPAGHIPGSAQIRVEYQDEVWVFTGDYKTGDDNISAPFDLQRCHVLVTESTFGLPVYRWKSSESIFYEIGEWWRRNQQEGKTSVIAGYTLGKSQHILANIDTSIGPVFTHGAIDNMNACLRSAGLALPDAPRVTDAISKDELRRALVLCPPSAVGSPWLRRFYPWSLGVASGWMKLRGTRRRRGADRGFVLSDHADWEELNQVVRQSGAEKVFVTHGYTETFSHWLNSIGIEAHEVKTRFEGELGEMAEGVESESQSSSEP
jgi:putative mRNA 3-end processing factor